MLTVVMSQICLVLDIINCPPDSVSRDCEEEQVPTDGGTSAEAMQVPLEEDDELEEEEIINDENFLGKRPLDSPEAEEMPAVKRPRLLSTKGDTLDVVLLEAREPLSSINTQKIPPMLSPVHVQDNTDLVPPSPEPPMLAPVAKSQMPITKPLEAKSFTPKAKTKTSSPGQKTKSPKTAQSPAMVGSPIRSPKTVSKEKKSPGRSKSPKSPKSPKVMTHIPQAPVRPETPNRTPSATISEKLSKETLQVKQIQTPPDAGKLNSENQPKKAVVTDRTIDDSINAVIARACAEREPDPFEFSSGSESEGDIFTSPKRISGAECTTPKASTSSNSVPKAGSTPLPLSGGASSSDNSWTMDASIDEVVRKAKLGEPANLPPVKEKEKEKESSKEARYPWKEFLKDEEPDPYKFKIKEFEEVDAKVRLKDGMVRKEREKHKDKKKDRDKGRRDKDKRDREKVKTKGREERLRTSAAPLVVPPKDAALPVFSPAAAARVPAGLPALSSMLPEKLLEEKENPVIPRLTLRVGAVPLPASQPPRPSHQPADPQALPVLLLTFPSCVPSPLSLLPPGTAVPARSLQSHLPRTLGSVWRLARSIRDEWGNQIWICPGCNKPDDGSPMIGCDDCDDWYHWPCVGIMAAPPEEMQWFCPKCANKKKDKKHKKLKHRAH
uniref:TATA-box binding protein associated factor 3 n=1 Tax=Panthera tigris altaica TaxID=74533 RepID=A0A8C9KD00_PANTA